MKHTLLLLLGLWISVASLLAQQASDPAPVDRTAAFELKLPELRKKDSAQQIPRVSNALYNKIEFLDSRSRPLIGVYLKGTYASIRMNLVLKQPVEPQLTAILDGLTDSTAGSGELLFQLRRFHYAEEDLTRYCFIEATLYAKAAGQYRQLLTLDTLLLMPTSVHVMEYMNWLARPVVCNFIRAALTLRPQDSTAYAIGELGKMDSIERHRLPLFTDTAWVDGLYLNYHSFSRQLPDRQCTVKMDKNGKIHSVKVLDAAGKAVEEKRQEMYAVVYQGQAYIATEYGLYPVMRTDNVLEFTGDLRMPPTDEARLVYGARRGLATVPVQVLVSQGNRTTFVMFIDPLNGMFVHLRKIEPPPMVGY